jgi:hypothetical protein
MSDEFIKMFLNGLQEYARLNRSMIESLFFDIKTKHKASSLVNDLPFGGKNRILKEIQKYCQLVSLNIKDGLDDIEKLQGKRVSVNTAITVLGNKFKQDIKPYETYFAIEGNKISYGEMDFSLALPIYIPIEKITKTDHTYYTMFNVESLSYKDKKQFFKELKVAKQGDVKGLDKFIKKFEEKSLDKKTSYRNITEKHLRELRIFLNISNQIDELVENVNLDVLKNAYKVKYK